MDNMDKKSAGDSTADAKGVKAEHTPGEGIRSLKTTNVFRVLNFELYAKPRKGTMIVGVLAFTFCVGYLVYWNNSYDKTKYYVATAEDGRQVLYPKKSRWDS